MRIAFGIVSLFPGGGLQRDCMEIARLIENQGHEVVIYTCRLRDFGPANDIPVIALQNDGSTNHLRQHKFAIDFLSETSNHYDLIVGFDKLLGLDVLYCADASIALRMLKQWYLYLFPRYRTFRLLEKSSFASNGKTKIVLLSEGQAIE
jgi:UDP-glucose:(heptosyl)LPS alpha-1,3-glucosyltransferase